MPSGVELIREERERQIEEEGFGGDWDLQYKQGELWKAAIVYAIDKAKFMFTIQDISLWWRGDVFWLWPWDYAWYKKDHSRIKQLQIAGALIAAEIDRLQAEEEDAKNTSQSDAPPSFRM